MTNYDILSSKATDSMIRAYLFALGVMLYIPEVEWCIGTKN